MGMAGTAKVCPLFLRHGSEDWVASLGFCQNFVENLGYDPWSHVFGRLIWWDYRVHRLNHHLACSPIRAVLDHQRDARTNYKPLSAGIVARNEWARRIA